MASTYLRSMAISELGMHISTPIIDGQALCQLLTVVLEFNTICQTMKIHAITITSTNCRSQLVIIAGKSVVFRFLKKKEVMVQPCWCVFTKPKQTTLNRCIANWRKENYLEQFNWIKSLLSYDGIWLQTIIKLSQC